MKTKICMYLETVMEGISASDLQNLLEVPPEAYMGDYALPCFGLAKKLRKAPNLIAEDVKAILESQMEVLGIAKIEVVGAYCNLFLNREMYAKQCLQKLCGENHGVSKPGFGKTVCMDYSSPNVAKNFHVGHLRTTVIGNSLYKIYEKLGYNVVRINHLGDWGTQFGKLIVAYKLWSSEEAVQEKGIEELLRIYIQFEKESTDNTALLEEARAWFVKMEQGNAEALAIWKWFIDISMVEFERIYELLNISFDSYLGESFYRDKVPALVKELEEKQLLEESQGARVISLEEYDMPPCLIIKSDGGSIYHSRDIAAVLYRKEKYDFEKCLYVTGLEQSLHFKQVFKAVELMGYEWAKNLVHVPYGLVSLEGAKLSTRKGNFIYAEDILKEAIGRALSSIEEKNPELENKEEVARMVGVGAVVFHDLFNQRIKNIDFSWDEVLSFEGTTGPYVQYTYARAKSILRKCGAEGNLQAGVADVNTVEMTIDWRLLTDDTTYELLKVLSGYEDAVQEAAKRYEPSVVARYAVSLAAAFNKFYHECPILHATEGARNARLQLVDCVQQVLKDACSLLGLQCPEEM